MITLVRLFIVNQHAICVRNFTAADAQSSELFNCQEIYGICIKNASEKLIDFRVNRHFHTQRGAIVSGDRNVESIDSDLSALQL